jgi:hypothetical protein
MLTPPRHLTPPPVYAVVRVSPFISLICISYLYLRLITLWYLSHFISVFTEGYNLYVTLHVKPPPEVGHDKDLNFNNNNTTVQIKFAQQDSADKSIAVFTYAESMLCKW